MRNALRIGPLLAAGLVVGLAITPLALTGCGTEEAAPQTAARYTTQGRVVMVKTPDSPASSLKIHHEAIPNFVDGQGRVVGMPSHPMDFPRVAEGIDAASLEVGQAVRITFDVTWEPSPGWIITELEMLPPDTRFAFEPETPGTEEPAEEAPADTGAGG